MFLKNAAQFYFKGWLKIKCFLAPSFLFSAFSRFTNFTKSKNLQVLHTSVPLPFKACVQSLVLFRFIQDVVLVKAGGPLGLSIIGGTDHPCHPFGADEPGVFISKVWAQHFRRFEGMRRELSFSNVLASRKLQVCTCGRSTIVISEMRDSSKSLLRPTYLSQCKPFPVAPFFFFFLVVELLQ